MIILPGGRSLRVFVGPPVLEQITNAILPSIRRVHSPQRVTLDFRLCDFPPPTSRLSSDFGLEPFLKKTSRGMIRMNHVMKTCWGVVLLFVTLVPIAHADDFKLSSNQRISCSRGLSAGKLNTATCRSYAYIFNVKTTEYFRCSVSLALTRDFQLLVRRHRNRAAQHQFVFWSRRLRGVGQRQQRPESARLHHHLLRPRLRHLEMSRHDVSVSGATAKR